MDQDFSAQPRQVLLLFDPLHIHHRLLLPSFSGVQQAELHQLPLLQPLCSEEHLQPSQLLFLEHPNQLPFSEPLQPNQLPNPIL